MKGVSRLLDQLNDQTLSEEKANEALCLLKDLFLMPESRSQALHSDVIEIICKTLSRESIVQQRSCEVLERLSLSYEARKALMTHSTIIPILCQLLNGPVQNPPVELAIANCLLKLSKEEGVIEKGVANAAVIYLRDRGGPGNSYSPVFSTLCDFITQLVLRRPSEGPIPFLGSLEIVSRIEGGVVPLAAIAQFNQEARKELIQSPGLISDLSKKLEFCENLEISRGILRLFLALALEPAGKKSIHLNCMQCILKLVENENLRLYLSPVIKSCCELPIFLHEYVSNVLDIEECAEIIKDTVGLCALKPLVLIIYQGNHNEKQKESALKAMLSICQSNSPCEFNINPFRDESNAKSFFLKECHPFDEKLILLGNDEKYAKIANELLDYIK